jgi:fermentation-respiration switch protein FrsA (DUF1100 family)
MDVSYSKLLTLLTPTIDVNEGVDLDAPELATEGVEQEQAVLFLFLFLLSRLPRLSKPIAFLHGKLDIAVYYKTFPAQID